MRLPAILALATVLLSCSHPVFCGGLLGGLVDYEPLRLWAPGLATPVTADTCDLDNPAMMNATSASIAADYRAENLVHTKKNGKVTTDADASGNTETLVVPIQKRGDATVLAMTRSSSETSYFSDDPKLGGRLSWDLDSSQWAVRQRVGSASVGLTGFHYSGECDGAAVYPRTVFGVLGDSTDTRFSVRESGAMLQLALPFGRDGRVSFSSGLSDFGFRLDLGRDPSLMSVPIQVDIAQYGVEMQQRLSPRILGKAAYSWSGGDGDDLITVDGQRAGRLRSSPSYSQIAASVRYQRKPTAVWELGYVLTERKLKLRGLNLDGEKLGLDFGTFDDFVDFTANMDILTRFYHLGVCRRVSDRWQTSARYKLIIASAGVGGDYRGRTFFGLISAGGVYNWSTPQYLVHDSNSRRPIPAERYRPLYGSSR